MHDFSSSGRLGPMVTCTLKLGISILNGGNVQVQQVRLSVFTFLIFNYLFYCQRMNRLDCSRVWLCTGCLMCFHLVIPRKCLITWKRKEMQASSRASRDWCSLAGTIISTGPLRKKKLLSGHQLGFDLRIFFSLVSWIWMLLRDRTKLKDLAWWQRKVQVSWETSSWMSEFLSSEFFPFQFRLKLSWSLL